MFLREEDLALGANCAEAKNAPAKEIITHNAGTSSQVFLRGADRAGG